MRNLLLFFHIAGAIFWMGGMAFMVMALRPALGALQPPQRLPLVVEVLRRFFVVVMVSIVLLLATGGMLLMQAAGGATPPGWHAMAALGIVMMLVFGHIFFGPWRRLKQAVAAQDWPEAGKRVQQIALLVKMNLAIGWVAIAAVLLWR
ncbi:CopD family protein [Ramlibacter sp. XY19]|uniref:CopD family protein n=1 Tax=Ramlibacter paludis TaxID=2908000 RepID=UPI0023DB10F1|nr:CopD family protein [Ramlibacter paludis]MCG2595856.1 CopD family protein [Ramlibacter paludis]